MANLQGWHLIVLLIVILLLFGATKLPALARSMGQSARAFKHEMKEMKADEAADKTAPAAAVVEDEAARSAAVDQSRPSN